MNKYEWGAIVWGSWFLAFVILEILGWQGWVPWPTLSAETRWLEDLTFGIGSVIIIVGLGILTAHLTGRYWQ